MSADCSDCNGHGYVVNQEARYGGDDPQVEESEPCWCMASVQRGWISMADHLRIAAEVEKR